MNIFFLFFRQFTFYFLFLIFFLTSCSIYADEIIYEHTDLKIGGQINSAFVNVSGANPSSSRTSGYMWGLSDYTHHDGNHIITDMGVSFEKSNTGMVLLNQMNIQYHHNNGYMTIGRMINAAGILHYDLSDFGTPSVGDNTAVNFFNAESMPINVAQQIAQPFANRVGGYYISDDKSYELGATYTPRISKYHPAGFEYYTGSDVNNEISIAGLYETDISKKLSFGLTAGYTHARYDNDMRNYFSGAVTAKQTSFYIKEQMKNSDYKRYEFGYGCLEGDFKENDCRAGFQTARRDDDMIYALGYKRRLKNRQSYDDYAFGYMFLLSNSTRIGFETLLRTKSIYDVKIRTLGQNLHWSMGISQAF